MDFSNLKANQSNWSNPRTLVQFETRKISGLDGDAYQIADAVEFSAEPLTNPDGYKFPNPWQFKS